MKQLLFSAATLVSALTLTAVMVPSLAHAKAAQPGNCAVWLEEAAKTVKSDSRFTDPLRMEASEAFTAFAKAQRQIVQDGMAKTYADSKAFGWDKAKVDQMMAQNETALRQGFTTSTMEPDRLYMDHVMAINNCAEVNKTDAQMGQDREAFIATLTAVFELVRAG
ncbi:hypothetical protein ACFFUB_10155 [Algimonas porphyrae]|uniref:Uncharacterized protein n=1 Tax=Algimonas porphyrae TaxID=1128113 RepID=A0ABQ5V477_9PROT|nr:hypothetical protein [Algimonas porphyrae]GLQ21524.1 hypothetical protein GCM10007854_24790 [Algimonas porphyrae]